MTNRRRAFYFPWAALGLLLSLAAVSVTCGGTAVIDPEATPTGSGGSGASTTTSSTGATGGSSAGGSGGTGGTGGTLPQCPPEIQQAVTMSGPQVGFDSVTSLPVFATIEQVDPGALYLAPSGPGTVGRFDWVGPSLLGWFQPGEIVELRTEEGWHVVQGASEAAALMFYDFVGPTILPPRPPGNPLIALAGQCEFLEASGRCGQPPAAVEVFELHLTLGDFVGPDVPYGQTAETGAFVVHNANTAQFPSYSSEGCDAEAFFISVVTVLRKAGL